MSYNYRCGRRAPQRCHKRYAFKKKIEQYTRPKKCTCGGNLYRVDRNKEVQSRLCKCTAAHYPHNRGSLEMCQLEPNGEPRPKEYWARFDVQNLNEELGAVTLPQSEDPPF